MPTATETIRAYQYDPTKVNSMEVGKELSKSLPEELEKTIERGKKALSEDEFAIVQMLRCDPRFPTALKRIFFFSAFLPKPKPDQAVWVFNRKSNSLTFMWSLPDPEACAILSWQLNVSKTYEKTAEWCRDYYSNKLIKNRREETGVTLETESEFRIANASKLNAHKTGIAGHDLII